jgi:hypothetical protein
MEKEYERNDGIFKGHLTNKVVTFTEEIIQPTSTSSFNG